MFLLLIQTVVSVFCEPGGGPGSAQRLRAANTGIHPRDGTHPVSHTIMKPAARLFSPTGGFYHIDKCNLLKCFFLKCRDNIQIQTELNATNYRKKKLHDPQIAEVKVKSIIKANWGYLMLDIKDVYIYVHKYTLNII